MRIVTDRILFVAILTLLFLGLLFVYSANVADSIEPGTLAALDSNIKGGVFDRFADTVRRLMGVDLDGWGRLTRQFAAAGLGLVGMMFLKTRHHFQLRNWKVALVPLGVTTVLTAVALVIGVKQRSIPMGLMNLQPSELVKPAVFLCLAYVLYYFKGDVNQEKVFWPLSFGLLGVVGIVGIGDFGTAAVIMATASIVLWMAGLSGKRIATVLGLAAIVGVVLIAIAPFRALRILAKFDPEQKVIAKFDRNGEFKQYLAKSKATSDMSYQPKQSRLAVGSGGLIGQGLMNGRQKVKYLPEAHNDFIFAVVAEEAGLGGALVLLACYLVICWRGLEIFRTSNETFGRYLALGVTVCITLQALLNISVALDLGPTKGIPLPLVSYGGSSMLGTLILLGLLLSVSDHAVMEEKSA